MFKDSQIASSYKFLIMIFGRPFLLLFQAPSSLDSSLRYLSHLLYSRLVDARKTYDSFPTDSTSNASFSSGTKINEYVASERLVAFAAVIMRWTGSKSTVIRVVTQCSSPLTERCMTTLVTRETTERLALEQNGVLATQITVNEYPTEKFYFLLTRVSIDNAQVQKQRILQGKTNEILKLRTQLITGA